jgi:hypothetical protein
MTAPQPGDPVIIKIEGGNLPPEVLDEIRRSWKANWERNKNKPPIVLPPDELGDAQKLRAAAEVLERRLRLAGKRSFLISVWARAMRRAADRWEAK